MKIAYEASQLTNPTMVALLGWVEQCYEFLDESDGVFKSMEEMGRQLEYWRRQHQPEDQRHREAVTIELFGKEEILISDKLNGEFIHVKKTTHVQLARSNG